MFVMSNKGEAEEMTGCNAGSIGRMALLHQGLARPNRV